MLQHTVMRDDYSQVPQGRLQPSPAGTTQKDNKVQSLRDFGAEGVLCPVLSVD
ncbi:MAG: hypothetical protein LBU62_08740 [Bacteroidales bacterium]|nr:hypothetical protein [Bacteroidales bacterium]